MNTADLIEQLGGTILANLATHLGTVVAIALAVMAVFIAARLAIRAMKVIDTDPFGDSDHNPDGTWKDPDNMKWWGLD